MGLMGGMPGVTAGGAGALGGGGGGAGAATTGSGLGDRTGGGGGADTVAGATAAATGAPPALAGGKKAWRLNVDRPLPALGLSSVDGARASVGGAPALLGGKKACRLKPLGALFAEGSAGVTWRAGGLAGDEAAPVHENDGESLPAAGAGSAGLLGELPLSPEVWRFTDANRCSVSRFMFRRTSESEVTRPISIDFLIVEN